MKCLDELQPLIAFMKQYKNNIKEHYQYILNNKLYVSDAKTRVGYDVLRIYCAKKYNSNHSYSCLYEKYDCNDKHIETLIKKAINEIL